MSVTLDEINVLWLKGRARLRAAMSARHSIKSLRKRGSVSPVTTGRITSVVGMVDLSDDPDLLKAEAAVREWFEEYCEAASLHLEDPPVARAGQGEADTWLTPASPTLTPCCSTPAADARWVREPRPTFAPPMMGAH